MRPEVRPVPDEQARELAAILARRRQVVGMLVAEGNRLETSISPVRDRIKAHIGFLDAELDVLDGDLDRAIRDSPVWREKDELLRSVPGVGPRVSATLLADLPELGTVDNKKVTALVGVAPLNRDSGVFRGQAARLGREGGGPADAVYGRGDRRALQPGLPGVLRAARR